jgi:hypothetical protein
VARTFTTAAATAAGDPNVAPPGEFALHQNYPNPFNPATTIPYSIGGGGTRHVRMVVCDVLGREVAVLEDSWKAPGSYVAAFDGAGMASGVYICRLRAGDQLGMRKMVLTR